MNAGTKPALLSRKAAWEHNCMQSNSQIIRLSRIPRFMSYVTTFFFLKAITLGWITLGCSDYRVQVEARLRACAMFQTKQHLLAGSGRLGAAESVGPSACKTKHARLVVGADALFR